MLLEVREFVVVEKKGDDFVWFCDVLELFVSNDNILNLTGNMSLKFIFLRTVKHLRLF